MIPLRTLCYPTLDNQGLWLPGSVSLIVSTHWFIPDHSNNPASGIQLQKEIEEIALEKKIRATESQGEVRKLKASLTALRQRKGEIHETTRLDKFLEDTKNPDKCGNVLDRMNISSSERPWFIRFVSSSCQALQGISANSQTVP